MPTSNYIELQNELLKAKQDAATRCLESYYEFFKLFFETATNSVLSDNWHIKVICDELQRYAVDLINDKTPEYDISVFNIPPSSSKSTMISVLFHPWLWLHMPNAVIISSSYAAALSMDLAHKSKIVLDSELYNELFQPWFKVAYGKNMRMIKNPEGDYENNFGGRRFCTSTGGAVTGVHGHLIIVDDGLKVEDLNSPTEVMKCNRFFNETLSSRKKNNLTSKTIIVMQRLCSNDLIGDLEQKGIKFKHFVFPAELTNNVKPESFRQYYIDGLLDPKRLPRDIINNRKTSLGSTAYAAQYLQQPYTEEGGILKKDYFSYIKTVDIPGYESIIWDAYIDGAYTKNTNNDPTGILICAKIGNDLVIKDWISEWLEFPDIIAKIHELQDYRILTNESRVKIEPKATGLSLQQILSKEGINAIAIHSKLVNQNKMSRARLVSPFAEAGRIKILCMPNGNIPRWTDSFITELVSFPNGIHDEAIDCLGYATEEKLHNLQTSTLLSSEDTYDSNEQVNPAYAAFLERQKERLLLTNWTDNLIY